MRIDLANLAQPFDACHSRHANVHDDGVGSFFLQKLDSGFDVVGRAYLIVGFQEHPQAFARAHFVIDDKNLRLIDSDGHVG